MPCFLNKGDDILLNKQDIRKKVLCTRESQDNKSFNDKSKAICDKIISLDMFSPERVAGKKIALYFSHKGEVDLSYLKEYLIKNKAVCFYPITHPDEICMGVYDSGIDESKQCKKGAMGIQEPKNEPGEFEKMDYIFLPGICFDINGNRIGYGKGYYDRYLVNYKNVTTGNTTMLLAPAFDFQLLDNIEHDEHDIPVDIIVTENRIINLKV